MVILLASLASHFSAFVCSVDCAGLGKNISDPQDTRARCFQSSFSYCALPDLASQFQNVTYAI